MKKNIAQWVLLLVLVAAALAACNETKSNHSTENPTAAAGNAAPSTTRSETATPPSQTASTEATAAGGDSATAESLYAKSNCAMCHGQDQAGGKLGPALAGLAANGWDKEKLMAYLADPKDQSVNAEHLSSIASQYKMAMPAFTGTDEERALLAEWLMSK